MTESYIHDANNNVTSQVIDGMETDYNYDEGQLVTATAGPVNATTGKTTADYNYDPFGRLDTVTSGGQTIQSNTYDGFDNLASVSQLDTTTGSMDTTSYAYDSLNRMASQTTAAGTSSFSYLGLSSELVTESNPGGTSKNYDYTPGGARLSQDTTTNGTTTPGYYSYNAHSDVEAVTGTSGTTTATYGYTAYGSPITSMFTGQDESDSTSSPTSTTQPYNSYRFNAMRWDSSTGQYDMGFRNYDPGLNQFVSRDMYDGALANTGLTTDPFTGSQYAFGDGNPISNIEQDGHMPCIEGGPCGSVQALERWSAAQAQANVNPWAGTPPLSATPNPGLQQLGNSGAITADPCPGAALNLCGVSSSWVTQAVQAAKQAGVDPALVLAFALKESSGRAGTIGEVPNQAANQVCNVAWQLLHYSPACGGSAGPSLGDTNIKPGVFAEVKSAYPSQFSGQQFANLIGNFGLDVKTTAYYVKYLEQNDLTGSSESGLASRYTQNQVIEGIYNVGEANFFQTVIPNGQFGRNGSAYINSFAPYYSESYNVICNSGAYTCSGGPMGTV
jgi:RHS repeat-associated protein